MVHSTIMILLALMALLCFHHKHTDAALSETAIQASAKMLRNTCMQKSKVTAAALADLKPDAETMDRPVMCYLHCSLTMMKVMKRNLIDADGALKQMKALMPEKYHANITEQLVGCRHIVGSDECEVAREFSKCAFQVNPYFNILTPQ